jgi:hypothetical protein
MEGPAVTYFGYALVAWFIAALWLTAFPGVPVDRRGEHGYLAFLFTCFLLYSVFYGHVRYRGAVDFVVVPGSGLLGSRVPPSLACSTR